MNQKLYFKSGTAYKLKGDVTTLETINNISANELEDRLGFAQGRLKKGYFVFFLIDSIEKIDFIWGDQTKFSGRWEFISHLQEYAQREDLLRFDLFKENNFDEAKGEQAYQSFLSKEEKKLNGGAGLIVKVLPVIPHNKNLPRSEQYPNSSFHGIPQWTVKRKLWFICHAFVKGGGDRFIKNKTL